MSEKTSSLHQQRLADWQVELANVESLLRLRGRDAVKLADRSGRVLAEARARLGPAGWARLLESAKIDGREARARMRLHRRRDLLFQDDGSLKPCIGSPEEARAMVAGAGAEARDHDRLDDVERARLTARYAARVAFGGRRTAARDTPAKLARIEAEEVQVFALFDALAELMRRLAEEKSAAASPPDPDEAAPMQQLDGEPAADELRETRPAPTMAAE